jgi:hypothetical protein
VYHQSVGDYPLRAAAELRRREEEERRSALDAAAGRVAAARARLGRAHQELVDARAAWRDARAGASARAAAGARAADLVAGERWLGRLRAEEDRRLAAVRTAEAALADAERGAGAARDALAAAHRAREGLARHEEEWRKSQRRAAERREE